MKITIAAGLYPPDVGGPSYYALGLTESLQKLGHEVVVVRYGSLRRVPFGISHLLYFCKVLLYGWRSPVVIALDTVSVGIPAALASRITRALFVVRIGGDLVWEHYLERTGDLVPLRFFYDEHKPLSAKERCMFVLTRWMLSRAQIVFSTDMQRDVWLETYRIAPERIAIIGNAAQAPLDAKKPTRKNFLWYTRPIVMKNGDHLHAAFERAKNKFPEIELEEGQVPKSQLLERMSSCYAVLLPSITEISPNYILDALRFHKPFIMDKYSGFAQWLSPYGTLVDPLDEADIQRAIEELASDDGYARALDRAAKFSFVRTYDDVAQDFVSLIKKGL